MDIYFPQKSYLNKKLLIISLLIGFVVNIVFLYLLGFWTANVQPIKQKQVKIKYIQIKPPEKKKVVKKKVKKETVKKPQKQKIAKGKKVAPKPAVPAITPELPEVATLPEEEISLPENEMDTGDFSDIPVETGEIKEFRAVTKGEFNPTFGTELSKVDKTATGTAIGRKLIYRPPPPLIKAKVPPPPVRVKLWINKDGTVSKVVLLETTGNNKVDQIIKRYVQSWKFNEIKENKEEWAVTTIRFKPSS